jgi:hypothetical protein
MSRKPREQGAETDSGTADDVEGHALPLVIGLGALGRGRDRQKPSTKGGDERLPGLTKPFPRLRDERPRG